MTFSYSEILKLDRFRDSSVPERTIITESESDRGRILFCAAFRRLQQKAQVFSLEPNAAVRSRLTHSLEVSQIGRYISDKICTLLKSDNSIQPDYLVALVTFVENACLMHDIGNPPFGHFGEAAIKKWFSEKGHECIGKACKPYGPSRDGEIEPRAKRALDDFFEFDGNPQGLRIVTKLQRNKDEFGLNLTKTTLAAYLKYVRMAGQPGNGRPSTKKAGYFSTERDVAENLQQTFGYVENQRFPLAYIMEAADDIAYCISDLEDSIEKELLDQTDALIKIRNDWPLARDRAIKKKAEIKVDHDYDNSEGEDENENLKYETNIRDILNWAIEGKHKDRQFTFTDFRTSLNREIVDYVSERYVSNQQRIFSGNFDTLLPDESAAGSILNAIKSYCRKKVYCHESVQWTELAGYTAIYGLLEHFKILLECSEARFAAALDYKPECPAGYEIVIEKKLLKLFPPKYILAYNDAIRNIDRKMTSDGEFIEWNARAHLIVDFVSGMTDDFAVSTYQTLSGMRI